MLRCAPSDRSHIVKAIPVMASRHSTAPSATPMRCPHCDSPHISQMADRSYEATSTVTWFHCHMCGRMWSQPKPDEHRATSEQPPSTVACDDARKALWQVGTIRCFLSPPSAAPPFVVEVRDEQTLLLRSEFFDHWDACAQAVKALYEASRRQVSSSSRHHDDRSTRSAPN